MIKTPWREEVTLAELGIEQTRLCARCVAANRGAWKTQGVVNARTAVEHIGDGGDTLCGIDATGPQWWWPL